MKKTMCFLLIAVMAILSACGNKETVQTNTLLDEYLSDVNEYEAPAHEAGDITSYVDTDDKLATCILYPQTGVVLLDDAVNDWVEKTVDEYKKELLQVTNLTEKAELSIVYESYNRGDIVSVKMSGTFNSHHLAHPEDISKTFIADTSKEKLLTADDIFTKEGKDKIIEMIVSETGANADDDILSNIVLTNDGVEIILNRGEFLPMSDGTKVVEFNYDHIGHLMNIPLYTHEEESEAVTEENAQNATEGQEPTEEIAT